MNSTKNTTESTTRKPIQDRSIKTREAIVQAAMKLFSEAGYHRTNTKQIAAAANVSTGSFYSYFTDKREVFMEALKLYCHQFTRQLDSLLQEMDFSNADKLTGIKQLIDCLVRSHDVYIGFHSELTAMYEMDSEVRSLIDTQMAANRENAKKYLYTWKDELKVGDLDAASIVVFEALDRLVDMMVFYNKGLDLEKIKAETADMIYVYLFVR
ncbi:TetR/AcrR family transcriptional regulator [Paenibacillus segetis]|uniref:AcrR family transcriptional regulator n=1 Tax=Paenibacillus segetis TaxID=1325360 RepID=A0ABQ1YKZ6_9BACL|nr:TetR/AcrR family transcriptional regulator [Paenibacillus segetis]GGH30076.1 AcrR family transcriptional regulator [Paenibacillus segetis]